jgi:hypothetical protein
MWSCNIQYVCFEGISCKHESPIREGDITSKIKVLISFTCQTGVAIHNRETQNYPERILPFIFVTVTAMFSWTGNFSIIYHCKYHKRMLHPLNEAFWAI